MSLKRFMPAALRRDERGNVAIIFGLSAVPLVFMLGMSVDFARAYYTRNLLQLASDQAALAASIPSGLTDSQRVQLALNSFTANTSRSTLTSSVVPCIAINTATNCTANGGGSSTITVGTASSAGSVSVAANANVPTYFLAIMNRASVGVGGQGTVIAGSSSQQIEIGMMIDLTGSMGWNDPATGAPKINSLKTAATSLMTILTPSLNSGNLRVAIAPMADYVNAGPYASAATGLPTSGGSYANISNLTSTKSGKYTGSYSGIGGGGGGQGYAATSSQTTYNNGYCANPTSTTTTTTTATWTDPTGSYGTKPYVNNNNNWGGVGGNVSGNFFLSQVSYSYGNQQQTYYYYFGPVVTTYQGQPYSYVWALSNNQWVKLTGEHNQASLYPSDYIPTNSTTSTTTTVPGCESTPTSSGSLISCVTERTGKDAYTDASPVAADYVGAYTQGNSTASNYSSDGQCYVAGRVLPAVIPLTSNATTLNTFFNNMSVGGGTPGHLGHAWAWYMVSPNWNSVWPATSQAAAYGGAKKFVVIMTDGEYNEQYSSAASTTQALNLCTGMKAAGITVYTIGFGFHSGSQPNDGSSDGAALGLLKSCASSNGTFFYPYDGNALKTAFQTVGNSILGVAAPSVLTH